MNDYKLVLIGRHGKAPQKPEGGSIDTLLPEAFNNVYNDVGMQLKDSVENHGIAQSKTTLTYSSKQRTKQTGQIVLVGGFSIEPIKGHNPPQSEEDLKNYDLSEIQMIADKRLLYGYPSFDTDDFNLRIFKEKDGPERGIDYCLANPESTEHDGQRIVSGSVRMKDCNGVLRDNLHRLLFGEKELGIIVSHVGRVESIIISAINSARNSRSYVKRVRDIGGICRMGEFASLEIYKIKGVYVAELSFKGQKYNVDINGI